MTDRSAVLARRKRPRALVTLLVLAVAMVAGIGAGVMAVPLTAAPDATPTPSSSGRLPVSPTSPSPLITPTPLTTPSSGPDLPRADAPLTEDQFVVPRGPLNDTRLYLGNVLRPGRLKLLTTPAGDRVNSPTLSADRRTLIYVDRTKGRLRTIAVDGTQDRQLFDGLPSRCDAIGHVSWSRVDPEVLVIRCTSADGPDRLMVIDLSGTVIRTLDDQHNLLDDPVISPDGQSVAYWAVEGEGRPGGGGIYIRELDGKGSPVRLTRAEIGRDADPAWSPDGTMIAFRRRVAKGDLDVYTMAADGSDARRVVKGPAVDEKPLFSPDGRKLMIISNRTISGAAGKTSDVYLVSVSGGALTPLEVSAPDISTPVWSAR